MPRARLTREQGVLLAFVAFAALACALGLATPPGTHPGLSGRALDVLQIAGTAALSAVLVLGPGLVLRRWRGWSLALGFVVLPGLALLVLTAIVAWLLAGVVAPWLVSLLVVGPVLAGLGLGVLRAGPEPLLEREERWALLVVGCALGIAIGRTLWSIGPVWELYGGTVSRTLEVGGRSDSRIPFVIVQLVANGAGPFSRLAIGFLNPFDFSSRGPLSGLASTPIVLAAGGRPPADLPNQPWMPFDPQGFMAFRIAAMTFAATSLLSLWTIIRRLGGVRAARFGLLLGATTPFLVHEIWFTWPKLFAASFVVLAVAALMDHRALFAGLLGGIAYLVHPGALIFLPALIAIAAWPLIGARLRRPQIRAAALVVAGALVWLVGWRVFNGSHYTQSGFLDYLRQAGWGEPATLHNWVFARLESIRNTFVPLAPYYLTDDLDFGIVRGVSPNVIYFYMQYWVGLPFGIGIVFFPLLLVSLWRAIRQWPWPVAITVIVPLVMFAIYWPFREGMLRESLQAWVLGLIAVVALQQRQAGFPWERSTVIRSLLALRALEVLSIAVVPTWATDHIVLFPLYQATDLLALTVMAVCTGTLAVLVWRERPPLPASARRVQRVREQTVTVAP